MSNNGLLCVKCKMLVNSLISFTITLIVVIKEVKSHKISNEEEIIKSVATTK